MFLLKQQRYRSYFILMRVVIEQYCSLINLLENEKYAFNIKYQLLMEQQRFMNQVEKYKAESKAINKVADNPNFVSEKVKLHNRVERLKKDGAKKISIKDCFIFNDKDKELRINMYVFTYNTLSNYAHGNLVAIDDIGSEAHIKADLRHCLDTMSLIITDIFHRLILFIGVDGLKRKIEIECDCKLLFDLIQKISL